MLVAYYNKIVYVVNNYVFLNTQFRTNVTQLINITYNIISNIKVIKKLELEAFQLLDQHDHIIQIFFNDR